MTASDEAQYEGPVRRIRRTVAILGTAGTIVVSIVFGLRTGAGFLVCAAASFFTVWRQQRIVESLGPSNSRRRLPVLRFMLQFGLLAAAGYVIVKYLEVNRLAAVSGLLVAGIAVILEIIYELIYGTA
jgi:hypothetical protein